MKSKFPSQGTPFRRPEWRRRAFLLVEVLMGAVLFTLVAAGVFAAYLMTLRTTDAGNRMLSANALANSIAEQVAGSGYEHVKKAVAAGGRDTVVTYDMELGQTAAVNLLFGQESGDIRIKENYSARAGKDGDSANAVTTATIAGVGNGLKLGQTKRRYTESTYRARVDITKPEPALDLYKIEVLITYSDALGRHTMRTARVVSSVSADVTRH